MHFNGLSLSLNEDCLDYTGAGSYYWYSIGTYDQTGYKPHFPGPYISGTYYKVQFADLWILIKHLNYISCPENLSSNRISLLYIVNVVVLE